MDTDIQIQAIKSQIEYMHLQIDNIQNQNNIMDMNMMNNQIGEQLFNLSFQLLNTGMQAFNTGKKIIDVVNADKFYEKLKYISEQINQITIQNLMDKMKHQQQMNKQMIMNPQMDHYYQMMNSHFDNRPVKNIRFDDNNGHKILIIAQYGTKVKEVLKRYKEKISGNDKKFIFLYKALQIKENERRVVEDFFRFGDPSKIQVIQI